MGRTSRWLRGLLGGSGKKDSSSSAGAGAGGETDGNPHKKKRWSFVKSFRDQQQRRNTHPAQVSSNERRGSYREGSSSATPPPTISHSGYLDGGVDPNKHAIAVAAATAAVAEAAVAAAQAAAAVVKLTSSSGRCATVAYGSGNCAWTEEEEHWAAVRIQAAFRGYLARRALHALKALVKLQALVRGHIVRKGTAETMRCMQALVRVQARARAGRSHVPETLLPSHKPSASHNPGPATPEKHERPIRTNSTRVDRDSTLKRNFSKPNSRGERDLARAHLGKSYSVHMMDERPWDSGRETKSGPTDDEKCDKILEIDPAGKPIFNTKRWNALKQSQSLYPFATDHMSQSLTTFDSPSKDSTTAQLSSSSTSSGEVQSAKPQVSQLESNDEVFSTAENSPHFYSASSRGGSARRGPFTPTSDCSRSYFSGYSDYPNYMSNTESSRAKVRSQSAPKQRLEFEKSSSTKRHSVHGFGEVRLSSAQRASAAAHTGFTNKVYPGSGRLDRLGMPIRSETIGYSGSLRTRY